MAANEALCTDKNKYLLEAEDDRLHHILGSFQYKDTRNCILLWMLLHTGARATGDFELGRRTSNTYEQSVFIRGLKGSNDREIPLPDWLFRKIESEAAQAKDVIFPITYNRLRQIWTLYMPVTRSFMPLRHTFAIRLFKKTKTFA